MVIQFLWGERKMEFYSVVEESDDTAVYVSPYIHNGKELEINVTRQNDVVCNVFTDNPSTKQRISWKNIELTTVTRNNKILYRLETNGFNHLAMNDDRRLRDRFIVNAKGKVYDGNTLEGIDVIIHDISDVGISFYAPVSYAPKSNQLVVTYTDRIDEKEFNIKVECVIVRTAAKAGNRFVGCKISKDNRDYQIYGLMKRLENKNRYRQAEEEKIEE